MAKIKLKITKSFPFAHRGCDVVEYTAGAEVETDDQDLIDTVLAEKWGSKVGEPRKTKDKGAAPENKAAGGDGADGGAGGDADGPADLGTAPSAAGAETDGAGPAADAPPVE